MPPKRKRDTIDVHESKHRDEPHNKSKTTKPGHAHETRSDDVYANDTQKQITDILCVWPVIVSFLSLKDQFLRATVLSKHINVMSTQPHMLPRKVIMRLRHLPKKSRLDKRTILRSDLSGHIKTYNPLSEVTTLVILPYVCNSFGKIAITFPKLVDLVLPVQFDNADAENLRLPDSVRSICVGCHAMTDMSASFMNNPVITIRNRDIRADSPSTEGHEGNYALVSAIDACNEFKHDNWPHVEDVMIDSKLKIENLEASFQRDLDRERCRLVNKVNHLQAISGSRLPSIWNDIIEEKINEIKANLRKEYDEQVRCFEEEMEYSLDTYTADYVSHLQVIKYILCEQANISWRN